MKGLSEMRVIWRHALRNAAVPLVTVIALSYANLLEGSVLTETVFAWPGLGHYITNSLQNADMNAVLGGTLVDRRRLRRCSTCLRPALPPARSEDALMAGAALSLDSPQAWRAWLLSRRAALPLAGAARPLLPRLARLRPQSARGPRASASSSLLILLAVFADLLAPYSPVAGGDLRTQRLLPPSDAHWFGTDDQARDIFSRLVYGSRITLFVVVLVALIATPIGLLVGTVAGYLGGWVDTVLMRITDIFLAFPRLILALAFVAALGPGIENAIIAIAITSWPPYARIARAETLTIRNSRLHRRREAAGRLDAAHHPRPRRAALPLLADRARHPRHGRHHPHRRGPRLPRPRRAAADAGMGRHGRHRPQLSSSTNGGSPPCRALAIFVVSLGFNLLGDGLRDVLDPKAAK